MVKLVYWFASLGRLLQSRIMPIPRLALALLTLVLTTSAVAGQKPAPAANAAQVDEIFKEFTKPDSPGCAVGVYQNGQVAYSRAYGMANLDHDVALTPGSVFHVASVSKQFTAAAILLLAQDGKLSVDDDIRKYVPELPDFGSRITLRHLAHHTSGVRDQWSLLGLAGWRYSRDLITDDDVLALLSRQKDLNFRPGERHLYSNSGYTLLAIVVSRVSGKPFREFTTERIFKPLGMANTHFRDNFNEIVKNQAYGYAPERGSFRLSVTNFDTAGATSLLTTVEDLAKWDANFEKRSVGGDVLSAGLLERGVLNSGERIDYAFGIGHGTYRGLATIGHGGSDAGYRSAILRFPEQRFGVSVLCNVVTNPTQFAQRVADVYLGHVLKPRTTPAMTDGEPEVPLPLEQLSRLAGLYWNAKDALSFRFAVEDGKLHGMTGTNKQALKSLGSGVFIRASGQGPRFTFDLANGGGHRVTIAGASGSGDVLDRAEPFVPTPAQLAEFAGAYRSDEIEAVYRMMLRDGVLRLERLKSQPSTLDPIVKDTFSSQPGTIRFTRDAGGRVNGFTLDAGRIRNVKFWKETAAAGTATSER
jgi:CubicO group peptidase (beta-lactamase class C family)